MQFGVVGCKYNFKNRKSRRIVLQLSACKTKLLYQDAKERGSWQVFSGSTSVRLSKFKGLEYGGLTENFKRHRRILGRLQRMNSSPNGPYQQPNLAATAYTKDEIWHPWKCVSLVRSDGSTLDLTIGDENSMLAFTHCFYSLICKPAANSRFLREIKIKKTKLKLKFEARSLQLELGHMFQIAIFKTLLDKQRLATAALQKALKLDGQAFHSVFYRSVDAATNSLREPTQDEQVERLANLIRHHTHMVV